MSALQIKFVSAKNTTPCRHFGGYVTLSRLLKQILCNFEIFNILSKMQFFKSSIVGSAREKNAILRLPEVGMSAK